jgi:hypothetical protein
MTIKRKSWRILAVGGIALVLAACDNGAFEKAGKAVDRAGQKAGDKIKEIAK